jgi:hypothetical protein
MGREHFLFLDINIWRGFLHPDIQFMMDRDEEHHFLFLDINICRSTNGSKGHTVNKKPIYKGKGKVVPLL